MDSMNAAFFALSDPTRRAILARLALGESTVMELARPFQMSQPAISKHLRVLEDARLIVRRIDGARRPCRLNEDGIRPLEDWLAMMREALAKNYDRLDKVLADMQTTVNQSRDERAAERTNRRQSGKRKGAR
jgi:DNA-binding transcriptional ArsR family regulator